MKRTNENLKKYHLKKGLKKFQNADIKYITFNMELDKVWHDNIKCNCDDVQLGEILSDDGPWILGNVESMYNKLFDFQFFMDESGEVCMQASPITEEGHGDILDRVFFTDIKVKLKEKPEITDDMLIVDGDMFGPNEEENLTFEFYDGFAIEVTNGLDESPLVLLYPTLAEVAENKALAAEIRNYCADEEIDCYNIALKYGKIFKLNDLR